MIWRGSAGLLLFLLSSLSGAESPAVPQGSWPVFRGNAQQTGVAGPLPARLEICWKVATGDSVEGTAAIADETVFIGSEDGFLYALDLSRGTLRWKYQAEGGIKGAVGYNRGAVYVGDSEGVFHCVDSKTGQKRWQFRTESSIVSGVNFSAKQVLFGSEDSLLHCLSLLDGKELWKFKVAGGPFLGTPVVTDRVTFAAGCDRTLHIIKLENGKEQEAIDLDGEVSASPAVQEGRLFLGTMTRKFLAVDWEKKAIVWAFEAAAHSQEFVSSAAVAGRLVIVGSRDRRIHALDVKTGQEKWSFLTRGKVDSSPVSSDNRILVGSWDGHLYVLDRDSGQELQKIDLGGPITASPAVAGSRLVLGTHKGMVYCLGKP